MCEEAKTCENSNNESTPNRNYKDSVFVDLHSEDKILKEQAVIDIYNALHDEKISKKDRILFYKLKTVFFHKVRNDVAFTVNDKLLVLLEHQSTINKNMAFRCLEYITVMYASELIKREDKFLPTPLSLPTPEFYTLYNGSAPYPARVILPLSDLFKVKPAKPQLELVVTVININHPDNQEFLDSCPILKGYKKLVDKVEEYKKLYGDKGYAMAIEKCIREGIEISDYLKRKTLEVMHMFSLEYNFDVELNAYKIAGREEGRQQGRAEGRAEGINKTARNMKAKNFDISLIAEMTGLTRKEIERL